MLGGGLSRSAVLGQQGLAQRRSHRPLLAGVLASFAAQHAARVLPLIGGTVKPSLPGPQQAVSCCSMPPAKRSSGEIGRPAMSTGAPERPWQLPRRAVGKGRKPPCAPARDSPAIHPRHDRQTLQARWRRPVRHRRNQHHDRGEIDLAAEKAPRWWGRRLAAAISRIHNPGGI
jgi:hypothetical protein